MSERCVLKCGWKGCGDRAGTATAVDGTVEVDTLRREPTTRLRLRPPDEREHGDGPTIRATKLRTISRPLVGFVDPRRARRRPGLVTVDGLGWICPGCGRRVEVDGRALARGLDKAQRRGRPATVILRPAGGAVASRTETTRPAARPASSPMEQRHTD